MSHTYTYKPIQLHNLLVEIPTAAHRCFWQLRISSIYKPTVLSQGIPWNIYIHDNCEKKISLA